ncbi:GGDEF and EAL domain-containing protein [Halorientalis salina]|uniref:GGDEF and EAL domain-containing protein n=1 Tax=Halorientalis salina TaxID=2932266 RepID=UPI0010AC3E15|nr:GGDEF and EAL domain-containing protein [Halorientalis salina]
MSGSERDSDVLMRDEMLERVSDAVVVLDSDFQCLTCNERAEGLLGTDADDIVGSHVWTVFPDMVGTEAQRKIEATMESGQQETCERYDDDIDRWFEVRVYPDEDGVSLFFTDITERRERELEVDRYERILGHLPVAIERATTGDDDEFTYVTEGLVELVGAESTDALLDHRPSELYANADEREALVESLAATGQVSDRPIEFETLAGDTFEGTITASREEISGGEYYVTIFESGTDEREHEQGLARADAMFRNAQDAIFFVDVDAGAETFVFERANPAYEDQTGLSTEDIRGETAGEILGDDAGETLVSRFRECVTTQEPVECELELPVPDDESSWSIRIAPVVVDGEVVQLVGSGRDVTDRKARDRDLARYETFVEIATEFVTVVDAEKTVEYVSPAATQVVGHEPDDIVGSSLLEHVHPDDREGVETEIGKLLGSPSKTVTCTYRLQQADGSWATVESRGVNRLDADAIGGLVFVTRDVTEQTDREQTLEQVRQRFELAVEGATISTWDWDREADEIVFNDEWTNMVGLASEVPEFDFDIWADVIHPDDVDDARAALNAHLDGETERYDQEVRMRTEDGDWQWVRTIGTVVDRDASGTATRATGLHIDIDERKHVQQGLSETTNTLEAVIKASPNAIVIVDPAGEVVLWNRAAERLFGWEKDEVLGEPVPFIPENKPSKFEPVIGQLNSGETIQTVKTRRQTKSGELRDVRLSSTRIDGEDEIVGYLGIFQDLRASQS